MRSTKGTADDLVIALDLGTSACKAGVYTADGTCQRVESVPYTISRNARNFVEQDPNEYIKAARSGCNELCAWATKYGGRVCAVGLSTQTPTLVFCDENRRSLGPAIVWQDARAEAEAEWLVDRVGAAGLRSWFGMSLDIGAGSTPAKLLWMKRNDPRRWRNVHWIMQPKDYVASAMVDELATDAWCAKGLVNLKSSRVHPAFLRLLNKRSPLSPPARKPDQIRGKMSSERAAEWGLPAGTPVMVGWSDALAGVLATGAFHHERCGFILAGSSEIVGASRADTRKVRGLFVTPASLVPAGLPLHYGPTQAGGISLEWVATLLGHTASDALAQWKKESPTAATPILFRPYLYGERAPYWDHRLCASFMGLRGEHRASDLVHAVLQGVSLQERLILERAEAGTFSRRVVLAGGAARDDRWNQLRANVLQRTLCVMTDTETSLRGAAMLAWSALKRQDLANPSRGWLHFAEVRPERSLKGFYQTMIHNFKNHG